MSTIQNVATADGVATKSRQPSNELEFLAFKLGEEEYGIDILKVQELRGYEAVTRIATAPEFFKGVINLRGTIAPIIDLRLKFSLATPTYDESTVVIIVNSCDRVMGMVVDSVSDVITLTAEQFRPAPDIGFEPATDYLIGLGVVEQRMLMLVDFDKLTAFAEPGLTDALAA